MLSLLMGPNPNWRVHYVIVSSATLLMGALFFFTKPDIDFDAEALKNRQLADHRRAHKIKAPVVTKPVFIFLGLSIALYMSMETSIMNYSTQYFKALGDPLGTSIGLSVTWAMMVPSMYFASRIHKHKERMVSICIVLAGLCVLLISLVRVPVLSILFFALYGLFGGPVWPTIISLAIDSFPDQAGKATSLIMPVSGLGTMFGNIFIGRMVDLWGPGDAYFVVVGFAAAALCTSVFARRFSIKRQRELAEATEEQAIEGEALGCLQPACAEAGN